MDNSLEENGDDLESREEIKDLLKTRMEQMHTYHASKENLAHAALAAQIVFASAVLTAERWPPAWVPEIVIPERWVALVAVTAIWALVHVFIRFQLRTKRLAAAYVGGILGVLKELVYDDWKTYRRKLAPCISVKEHMPRGQSRHAEFVDRYFFPLRRSLYKPDEGLEGFPEEMVKQVLKIAGSTGSIIPERILTSVSIVIFIILLVHGLFAT